MLICTYQETPYRVVGCSRMGAVWLSVDLENITGYDYRVSINDCSKWSMHMADGSAVDMDSPWRICRDHEVVGNFIPTVVDSCNRTVWAAHTYAGVYEHIVALHNASLKPRVSEWEKLANDEVPTDAHLHDDPLHDRRIAHSEGWDLFYIDTTGIFEIQRDADADKFPDDQAAIDFVRAAGTPYHQKAIAIHEAHAAEAFLHRAGPPVRAYLADSDRWERLAIEAKRDVTLDHQIGKWAWYDRETRDDRTTWHSGFTTRIEALADAIGPLLSTCTPLT